MNTIPINVHCEWFASVLDMYRNQTPVSRNARIHLYAFALKYLAILVKHDDGLAALIETRTLQSMINQLDVGSDLKDSSIFNAYMSLLQTLNTHKRGLEYVFQEGKPLGLNLSETRLNGHIFITNIFFNRQNY